jgi:hypothetical protein
MVWILYSVLKSIADSEQTWEPEGVAASSFQASYRTAQSKIERAIRNRPFGHRQVERFARASSRRDIESSPVGSVGVVVF